MSPAPIWPRALAALDLHIVGIVLIPLLLAAMLPWAWVPWLSVVLPMGRLATRAGDLRRSAHPVAAHLAVNGAVIGLFAAAAFLVSPAY